MAGEKISMFLTIDGNQLGPISAAPEKEEVYRRAAAEANAYITNVRKIRKDKLSDQKYLALAVLKFAIDKIDLMRSREVVDEDMTALKNIDERLDSYLNSLADSE